MVGLGPLLDILRLGEGLMAEALPLPGDSIVQLVQNTHLEASYSHKKWRSSPQKNWAPGLLTSTTTIAQKLKSAVIFALLDSLSLSLSLSVKQDELFACLISPVLNTSLKITKLKEWQTW